MRSFLLLLFIGLFQYNTHAQVDTSAMRLEEDTLIGLSMIIRNDTLKDKEIRYLANKDFIPQLVKSLKNENSFYYPFKKLTNVSIVNAPDNSFRIFTWQMKVDTGQYHYYGAIQMNEPELKLYPLVDRSSGVKDFEHETLNNRNWYGCLYYSIIESPSSTKKKKQYLVFGYESNDIFNRSKLIDVLTFDKESVTFGAPIFEHRKPNGTTYTNNRARMTFTFEASTTMRYSEFYDMIIFDHLIPIPGRYPGQGTSYVPDGSYQGYKWIKNRWVFVDKVFQDYQEEAPVPKPVLNDGKADKDVFGSDKN